MSPASYRKPGETGLVGHLKEYWFLYAFACQIIWSFGFVNFTIQDHGGRIDHLESQQQSEEIILSEIKARLSSIDTSIKYIETTLSKM